jgi:hypothetical protein
MLKAPICLELQKVISEIKPGKSITWPVYNGKDVLDAKTVEDYVTVFFKTGDLMPIPVVKDLGLNIHGVTIDHDDDNHNYLVTIEGVVMKLDKER